MNAVHEREFALRRIVVAVDSSDYARAAVEAAAELAAEFKAALEGLFVEDVNLVHLAALPVGRLVSFPTGDSRDYTNEALEHELRSEQARARRTLASVTARRGVHSSFRVVRGQVVAEIMAAAAGADLLILGFASRQPRPRPGSVALAAAERGPRSVLLLQPGARLARRPLVCFDGSATAAKALRAAASLAGTRGAVLSVLITADDPESAKRLSEQAGEELEPRITHQFLYHAEPTPDALCSLVAQAGADALVMSADEPLLSGERRRELLRKIRCPLLLVR